MSSGYERLYHQFKDVEGNEYFIEFYKDSIVNSYEIHYSDANSVRVIHGGADKNGWDFTYIYGQELTFKFYIPREDIAIIDDILESEYQDWHVRFRTVETTPKIIFLGYLKPENLYKRFEINPPYIEIELSATDGLAELKDVDFYTPDGSIMTGQPTLLQVIKTALESVNIALSFYIQLNTYESVNMEAATSYVLASVRCNAEQRFYTRAENKNNIQPMKCWDVLEAVLKIFNCKLFQHNEYYYIVNFQELYSNACIYDWDVVTRLQDFAPVNNIVDISDYNYFPYVEQQKVHPAKSIKINVKNSVAGNNSLVDLSDWDATWDLSQWDSYVENADGTITLNLTSFSQPVISLNSAISIFKPTDGNADYFRIRFDYRMTSFTVDHASMNYIRPKVRISRQVGGGDPVWSEWIGVQPPNKNWQSFDSGANLTFYIGQDAYYNIEFNLDSIWGSGHFTALTFELANFKITQYKSALEQSFNPLEVGVEKVYYQINPTGFENLEIDVPFYDPVIASEDASLLVFNAPSWVPTVSWNSYGNLENVKIVDLCARHILWNRKEYKNFLRCTIVDRDYILDLQNILTIQSKNYVFSSYERDFRLCEIQAELIELRTGFVPVDYITIEDVTLEKGVIPVTGGTKDYMDITNQPQHDFEIGNAIRIDLTALPVVSFVKAQANSIENSKVIGIVKDVINSDSFVYASTGSLKSAQLPYTEGERYYLSPVVAGKIITETELESVIQVGDYKVCIGFGTDKGFEISINNPEIYVDNYRTSGFELAGGTDSVIDYSAGVFSIEPVDESSNEDSGTGHSFVFFQRYKKLTQHIRYDREELVIPEVEGLYMIYYNFDEFNSSTTDQEELDFVQYLDYILNPTDAQIQQVYTERVIVAWLYYSDILSQAIYFGDSRHGSEWNPQIHYTIKTTGGLKVSGLALTGIIPNGDGTNNTHVQFTVSAGSCWFGDILKIFDSVGPEIPVMYFDISGLPILGITPGYAIAIGSRICFCNSGTLTSVTNEYFVIYHIFVSNCQWYPVISVVGLSQYESYILAKSSVANEQQSIILLLSNVYSDFMLVDSVIFQAHGNDFTNNASARIVQDLPGKEDIAFDFNDVAENITGIWYLDLGATFPYRIKSVLLQSDDVLVASIKVNDGVIGNLGGIAVTSSVGATDSIGSNSVGLGGTVTLEIEDISEGSSATLIRGKLQIQR